tara:strand:- start:37 stop:201 length:165 start_codon:yes stop_codon:yes gene_type:complete
MAGIEGMKIEFRHVSDDEPALAFSPLLRGFQKTFSYLQGSCQTNQSMQYIASTA